MRERSKKVIASSPEALFIFGGEEMSPVYPQPGRTTVEQWDHCTPYDRGAAAIDHMQDTGYETAQSISFNLARRDVLVSRISRNVLNAIAIESQRQKIADFLNNIKRA